MCVCVRVCAPGHSNTFNFKVARSTKNAYLLYVKFAAPRPKYSVAYVKFSRFAAEVLLASTYLLTFASGAFPASFLLQPPAGQAFLVQPGLRPLALR